MSCCSRPRPGTGIELNPPAKIWLQIRLLAADLPVREVAAGSDSDAICALCRTIDRAVALLADVSVRDSLVYLGAALAHDRGKLVRYLAHQQVTLSDEFGKIPALPRRQPLAK